MSAPLRLTATDLRHLADGLDALNELRVNHRIMPGPGYDLGVSLTTEGGDEISLSVALVDDELTIDDRYGS